MQLIIQENSDLKKENKEKTEALVELAEYYEVNSITLYINIFISSFVKKITKTVVIALVKQKGPAAGKII